MEVKLRNLALAAAAFAALECALILLGTIQPILSYSLPDMLFSIAYYAILAIAGFQQAGKGWLSAAKDGAIIAAARMAIIVIAVLIGLQVGTQVLGAGAGRLGLPLFLASIAAINILIGAFIAAAFSLAFRYSGCCGKKKEKKTKKKK